MEAHFFNQATTFELRLAATLDKITLQYRERTIFQDAWDKLMVSDWSEWKDIPTVHVNEEKP